MLTWRSWRRGEQTGGQTPSQGRRVNEWQQQIKHIRVIVKYFWGFYQCVASINKFLVLHRLIMKGIRSPLYIQYILMCWYILFLSFRLPLVQPDVHTEESLLSMKRLSENFYFERSNRIFERFYPDAVNNRSRLLDSVNQILSMKCFKLTPGRRILKQLNGRCLWTSSSTKGQWENRHCSRI